MNSSIRTRVFSESNYKSVFFNGKTLRMPIDLKKKVTELKWPEFYDVAINSKCYGGCSYCYTSATSKGENFSNIVEKINGFFGVMPLNNRPFQVAIGGAGESLIHPKIMEVLETFDKLGIVPNYTTNAMHFSPEIIGATIEYCGGVAITLHNHLEKHWRKGLELMRDNKIKTNVHLVISGRQSIDKLKEIYNSFPFIEYFVLLPRMNVGFAANNPEQIDYEYFGQVLDELAGDKQLEKVAFGANFYPWLKTKKDNYGVSLYEPEIFSKYIIMDDDMNIYNNSFEKKLTIKAEDLLKDL